MENYNAVGDYGNKCGGTRKVKFKTPQLCFPDLKMLSVDQ